MRIRDCVRWHELSDWVIRHLRASAADAPQLERLFAVVVDEAVQFLGDRDFLTVDPNVPIGEWVDDYGFSGGYDLTGVSTAAPPRLAFAILEGMRAMWTGLQRAGGSGLGMQSGSAIGVSETYTPASAESTAHLLRQAMLPWLETMRPNPMGRGRQSA